MPRSTRSHLHVTPGVAALSTENDWQGIQQAVAARDAAQRLYDECPCDIHAYRLRAEEERVRALILEACQHPPTQADPAPVLDTWEVAFDLAGPVLRILAYGLFAAIVVAQVAGWVR